MQKLRVIRLLCIVSKRYLTSKTDPSICNLIYEYFISYVYNEKQEAGFFMKFAGESFELWTVDASSFAVAAYDI